MFTLNDVSESESVLCLASVSAFHRIEEVSKLIQWHYINGVTDKSAMRYKTSNYIDSWIVCS